jgi:benzoate/toluate 1,2-dioxygenase subunit beta
MSTTLDGAVTREVVEAFLFLEARLCDESKYDEWSALWTDDGTYWVPVNSDDYDPRKHLSIIYDDRAQLQDRLDRLKSGKAWAQEPPSRMCHTLSHTQTGHVSEKGEFEPSSKHVPGELLNGL